MKPSIGASVAAECRRLLGQTAKTCFDLFKITVPISILVKILSDAGAIGFLGSFLSPVMDLVGLPGSMGLVWAAGLMTNLYGALVVFASLAAEAALTVAQVTVLTTMLLIAHALPVELRIAQMAGPRFWTMILLRLFSALMLGWMLNHIYRFGDFLQHPNRLLWQPAAPDPSWTAWIGGELRTMAMIFAIILVLLVVMRVLEKARILDLFCRLLERPLIALGMTGQAAPITVIGMTLGLSYGGALIIQEARSGRLGARDIFLSLALMGLCHSIVEDTFVMMLAGGHLSGLLAARLLFSLTVVFLLGKFFQRISEESFRRYFFPSWDNLVPKGGRGKGARAEE
ncbi:MAG: hypothetical protein GX751_07735 [Desulfuromonadaceae bacterium]|nr:hypothetical protein [Desulfuromonadaceae bacterium]